MSTDVQLPENLSSYSSQRSRHHSASDESRSGSPSSPKPSGNLNPNSLAASALMLQQMYPHFQDRRLLEEHPSPPNFNAAALCDQFCNVINGFRGPNFSDPRKSPGVPCSRPSVDATECRLIDCRGEKVAAFAYQGDYLLCLPQAFELFLRHLVGGLHTVYAKLKRLGISPIVCNVEQVRVLRGLGAIQPGVNRCKLLACKDFDVLYKDCTTARPGRPPGRASLVGLSGVSATSPSGHGYPPLIVKPQHHHNHADHDFDYPTGGHERGSPASDPRTTSEREANHLKSEARNEEENGHGMGGQHENEGMNIPAMLFKMWGGQPGQQGNLEPQKAQGFPANLPPGQAMTPAMAAAMASQMDLMLGLQQNPQIAAAAAAAYQRQLLQAASLAQQAQHLGKTKVEGNHAINGREERHDSSRRHSRSPDVKNPIKDFRSRESESPATGHQRSEHHQSRKSSFESSKSKLVQNNNNNPLTPGQRATSPVLGTGSALNLTSCKDKKRHRSMSSEAASLSDGALSELSENLDDDTSNYGDDEDLDKPGRSPKRDRDDALSTSSRDSGHRSERGGGRGSNGSALAGDSNHSVPTPIALMQQHLSIDRTPPANSPHITSSAVTGVTSSHTSIEALLQNILGLLKVAEENARTQEQQMHLEKAELKVEILREREIREQLEKQLLEEQNRRQFYQKRLRREKRCRKQMQEQLECKRAKMEPEEKDKTLEQDGIGQLLLNNHDQANDSDHSATSR